jgi:hypothetical protein
MKSTSKKLSNSYVEWRTPSYAPLFTQSPLTSSQSPFPFIIEQSQTTQRPLPSNFYDPSFVPGDSSQAYPPMDPIQERVAAPGGYDNQVPAQPSTPILSEVAPRTLVDPLRETSLSKIQHRKTGVAWKVFAACKNREQVIGAIRCSSNYGNNKGKFVRLRTSTLPTVIEQLAKDWHPDTAAAEQMAVLSLLRSDYLLSNGRESRLSILAKRLPPHWPQELLAYRDVCLWCSRQLTLPRNPSKVMRDAFDKIQRQLEAYREEAKRPAPVAQVSLEELSKFKGPQILKAPSEEISAEDLTAAHQSVLGESSQVSLSVPTLTQGTLVDALRTSSLNMIQRRPERHLTWKILGACQNLDQVIDAIRCSRNVNQLELVRTATLPAVIEQLAKDWPDTAHADQMAVLSLLRADYLLVPPESVKRNLNILAARLPLKWPQELLAYRAACLTCSKMLKLPANATDGMRADFEAIQLKLEAYRKEADSVLREPSQVWLSVQPLPKNPSQVYQSMYPPQMDPLLMYPSNVHPQDHSPQVYPPPSHPKHHLEPPPKRLRGTDHQPTARVIDLPATLVSPARPGDTPQLPASFSAYARAPASTAMSLPNALEHVRLPEVIWRAYENLLRQPDLPAMVSYVDDLSYHDAFDLLNGLPDLAEALNQQGFTDAAAEAATLCLLNLPRQHPNFTDYDVEQTLAKLLRVLPYQLPESMKSLRDLILNKFNASIVMRINAPLGNPGLSDTYMEIEQCVAKY